MLSKGFVNCVGYRLSSQSPQLPPLPFYPLTQALQAALQCAWRLVQCSIYLEDLRATTNDIKIPQFFFFFFSISLKIDKDELYFSCQKKIHLFIQNNIDKEAQTKIDYRTQSLIKIDIIALFSKKKIIQPKLCGRFNS